MKKTRAIQPFLVINISAPSSLDPPPSSQTATFPSLLSLRLLFPLNTILFTRFANLNGLHEYGFKFIHKAILCEHKYENICEFSVLIFKNLRFWRDRTRRKQKQKSSAYTFPRRLLTEPLNLILFKLQCFSSGTECWNVEKRWDGLRKRAEVSGVTFDSARLWILGIYLFRVRWGKCKQNSYVNLM